jgi:hypothetical protein
MLSRLIVLAWIMLPLETYARAWLPGLTLLAVIILSAKLQDIILMVGGVGWGGVGWGGVGWGGVGWGGVGWGGWVWVGSGGGAKSCVGLHFLSPLPYQWSIVFLIHPCAITQLATDAYNKYASVSTRERTGRGGFAAVKQHLSRFSPFRGGGGGGGGGDASTPFDSRMQQDKSRPQEASGSPGGGGSLLAPQPPAEPAEPAEATLPGARSLNPQPTIKERVPVSLAEPAEPDGLELTASIRLAQEGRRTSFAFFPGAGAGGPPPTPEFTGFGGALGSFVRWEVCVRGRGTLCGEIRSLAAQSSPHLKTPPAWEPAMQVALRASPRGCGLSWQVAPTLWRCQMRAGCLKARMWMKKGTLLAAVTASLLEGSLESSLKECRLTQRSSAPRSSSGTEPPPPSRGL